MLCKYCVALLFIRDSLYGAHTQYIFQNLSEVIAHLSTECNCKDLVMQFRRGCGWTSVCDRIYDKI